MGKSMAKWVGKSMAKWVSNPAGSPRTTLTGLAGETAKSRPGWREKQPSPDRVGGRNCVAAGVVTPAG